MPRITFHPTGRSVSVPPGTELLDAAREARVEIESPCGGKGTCGKCIDRCPVRAITEAGHDKEKCRQHLVRTREYVKERYRFVGYGCGLCQVGVPCEAGIPVRAARKALERGVLPQPPPPLA